MRHNYKSLLDRHYGKIKSFLYTTFKLDGELIKSKYPLTKDLYEYDISGTLIKHLDIHPLSGYINKYSFITTEKENEILVQKFLNDTFKEYKIFTKNNYGQIILEEKCSASHFLKRRITTHWLNDFPQKKFYSDYSGLIYFGWILSSYMNELPIQGSLDYMSKKAIIKFYYNNEKILIKEDRQWNTGKVETLTFVEFDNFHNWTKQIQEDYFGNRKLILREIKYHS